MTKFFSKNQIWNILLFFLWVGATLVCIKSIFVDFSYDDSYSVAMSYRHINGDSLFQTMWEPHMTSIYMTDILMYLYRLVVPDLTGIVLFLQFCGTLLFILISIPLYKCIRMVSSTEVAQLACIFFNVFRAKQNPFPEYANLMIGFATLTFAFFVFFIKNQRRVDFLIYIGIFSCLAVLAYPSTILIYPAIFILLCIFSEKKAKNILIYTMTCLIIGSVYVAYFLCRLGFGDLIETLSGIVGGDTHYAEVSAYSMTWLDYFKDSFIVLIWSAFSLIIAYACCKALKFFWKKEIDLYVAFSVILFISEIVMLVLQKTTGVIWINSIFVVPVILIILSFFASGKISKEEKMVWISGQIISFAVFAAALILSDRDLTTLCAYLVLGACVSFIPLKYISRDAVIFLIVMCYLVVTHRGLVTYGYTHADKRYMVYELNNYIRSGPSKGIICDTETACRVRDDLIDHNIFINNDDTFMLVDDYLFDSVEFLFPKGKIGNFTTIDTPFYTPAMERYYEKYPEQIPTVVAVWCPYGARGVASDSYIMKWIEDGYDYVGNGRYWEYYRQK